MLIRDYLYINTYDRKLAKSELDKTINKVIDLLESLLINCNRMTLYRICFGYIEIIDEDYNEVELFVYIYSQIRVWMLEQIINCVLLTKNQTLLKIESNSINTDDFTESDFNRILPALNRKQFDYLINRFFFFENVYNPFYEKKLHKLFCNRHRTFLYSKVNESIKLSESCYILWLNNLPPYFLAQIGKLSLIYRKHPNDVDKFRLNIKIYVWRIIITIILLYSIIQVISFLMR